MSRPTEENIPRNIRMARRIAAMTQEEAAHDLGVTTRTFARWETGESKGFMEHLDDIAVAFDTTTDQLLGVDDGTTAERVAALEGEIRELRALLLDPARLKAAADALIEEERPARRRRR